MGLCVEVMCDVKSYKANPSNRLDFLCWSHANNNPQGPSIAIARKEARKQGWKLKGHRAAVCPGCQTLDTPT